MYIHHQSSSVVVSHRRSSSVFICHRSYKNKESDMNVKTVLANKYILDFRMFFFYMCYSIYIKYVYIGENIVIHINTYTYSYVFIHIHYIYVISTGTGTSRSVGSCIIVGSSLWAVV